MFWKKKNSEFFSDRPISCHGRIALAKPSYTSMIVGENMVKLKPSICGGFPSHSKPLIRDQARLLRCILQAGSGHAIQHLKAEADGASGRRVRGKPMENPTFGGLEDIRKMCFLQMDP